MSHPGDEDESIGEWVAMHGTDEDGNFDADIMEQSIIDACTEHDDDEKQGQEQASESDGNGDEDGRGDDGAKDE